MTKEDIKNALVYVELENIYAVGDPVRMFRVQMNDGYCMHIIGRYDELMYKTVGIIYPTDDLTQIIVCATTDIPDGAEINGGETEPDTEVM